MGESFNMISSVILFTEPLVVIWHIVEGNIIFLGPWGSDGEEKIQKDALTFVTLYSFAYNSIVSGISNSSMILEVDDFINSAELGVSSRILNVSWYS